MPFTIMPGYRGHTIPGQVPGQGGQRLDRLLDMPKAQHGYAMLDHTEPRLTPESIVKGLGLAMGEENEWRGWLRRNLSPTENEVVIRKALYSKFLEDQTPPELRRAIFQRALVYYNGMRKSLVEVVSVDELKKADALGGNYYRRVANEKGGYRYYYDPESYQSRDDAHIDGGSALSKRLQKLCVAEVEKAGEAGCNIESLKALSERFGADKLAAALDAVTAEGGPIEFRKGYFRSKSFSKSFIITR